MKSAINMAFIIILILFSSCKAQTTADYINFYNDVVPKLNSIVPNKTQFYGQDFSNFYNELQNKNLNITALGYGYKIEPSSKYYILDVYFENSDMTKIASLNDYQYPLISITFENEIPSQIKDMILQSQGQWNSTFAQYFSNMKIEKILFVGVNGYNSTDWSGK